MEKPLSYHGFVQVWQDPNECLKYRNQSGLSATALTIGNFDGVHLGHQELLSHVRTAAEQQNLFSLLLTFHPHPMQILAPEKLHLRLFSLEDQQDRLASWGLQGIVRQPFSREFSQTSALDFLENYLWKYFQPQVLVVGHDFSFGVRRSGNLDLLEDFCRRRNVFLKAISPLEIEGEIVSTSKIRENLLKGNLARTEKMLGRKYYLKGIVEKGEMRGRQIGFPTANIRPDVDFFPKMGVYACMVHLSPSRCQKAVMNVGMNRTFVEGDHNPIKAEVHLLDFSEDLYGRTLKVELCHYLREERKFASIEALSSQIKLDIIRAQEILR